MTVFYQQNAPGEYAVSDRCIGCCLCAETAPALFAINQDAELYAEYSYIHRQPESADERRLAAEAMDHCPASAIHRLAHDAESVE